MKKLKSLIALLLVGVLVVGCGGSEGTDDTNKTSDGDKTIVSLAYRTEPTVFDPTTETNAGTIEMINAQSEGLYRLEVDEKGETTAVLGMAESVEVSDDETEYTFTLRDTKWSNGDPVTAADFVFSFRRLFDTKNTPDSVNNRLFAMKGLLGILNAEEVEKGAKELSELGVEAIDEKTFKLTLQDPCPIIGNLLAYTCFYPLNEKFVTEKGSKFGTNVANTLSCGPYILTGWEPTNSVTFEKNPDYYAADEVKVDGIEFLINTEANSRALAYESGEVMYAEITSELIDKYKGDEAYTEYLQSYVGYLSFNQAKVEDFKNQNYRKALALSIDKETLTEDILKDGSIPANFIIPEGLATGPTGNDFRKDAGSDYLATDKKAAKEYFKKAKEELGKDTFTFKLMVGESDLNKSIAEYIKSEIETNLEGVEVVIDIQPSTAFYEKAEKLEHEVLSIMWGPDYPYPTTYTNLWKTGDAHNYSSYSSEAYDALAVATTSGELLNDPEARWEALIEMEKILLEDDTAIAPLFQRAWVGLVNPKLKGIGFRSSGVKWDYRNLEVVE